MNSQRLIHHGVFLATFLGSFGFLPAAFAQGAGQAQAADAAAAAAAAGVAGAQAAVEAAQAAAAAAAEAVDPKSAAARKRIKNANAPPQGKIQAEPVSAQSKTQINEQVQQIYKQNQPNQPNQPNQVKNPPTQTPPPANGDVSGAPTQEGTTNSLSELEGFLEPFIYDVVNRRDPFQPYSEYVAPDVSPTRPLTPAQRYELDQLHLIGIMWDVKDPRAMFLDPEKEVLVLGRDEGIGNHNGYIASIREGEVVVVEAIRKRGDVIYKTRVLHLDR